MTAPNLTAVKFPTLHTTQHTDSHGTVTGTGIGKTHKVKIRSTTHPNWKWKGTVGDPVAGQADTYNATVQFDGPSKITDTVGVTVTNAGNEESGEKQTNSDVVP
jgi:hypothetical protein